jgi:hypothetical protein
MESLQFSLLFHIFLLCNPSLQDLRQQNILTDLTIERKDKVMEIQNKKWNKKK